MKKSFFLLACLAITLLFSACKDNSNSPSSSDRSFDNWRPTSVIAYKNSDSTQFYKLTYNYEGEKLVSIEGIPIHNETNSTDYNVFKYAYFFGYSSSNKLKTCSFHWVADSAEYSEASDYSTYKLDYNNENNISLMVRNFNSETYIKAVDSLSFIYNSNGIAQSKHISYREYSWDSDYRRSYNYNYTYDNSNNLICVDRPEPEEKNDWGDLYSDSIKFEYTNNRVTKIESNFYMNGEINEQWVRTFEYNENGSISLLTGANQGTLAFQYEDGLLTSIVSNEVDGFSYNFTWENKKSNITSILNNHRFVTSGPGFGFTDYFVSNELNMYYTNLLLIPDSLEY
jgi:hypothetical protein